ncbi:MAG: asparagine synthetase B, partial [Crocinitomix sp.]|nr:asparagine synthetase B [Crocinitomix sp.]
MCGINGIYKYAGNSYSKDLITNMNQALERRGPDADGVYTNKYVHFGHQRLAIIDLNPASDQPFISHDGRYVLVF